MDRILDSGSDDGGSNPFGNTWTDILGYVSANYIRFLFQTISNFCYEV